MGRDTLPSFDRPPVIETVLGVQFDPIPGFSNAHLGAFWETLGDGWSHVQDAPVLNRVIEEFGGEQSWNTANLTFTQNPASRLQIQNTSEDRMIQIQNSRFHYNWLGQKGGQYPRYDDVRPKFDEAWVRFKQFLRSRSLDQPQLNQWEVTYVNHIPKGTVWNDSSDWGALFPGIAQPKRLPSEMNMEGFQAQWHFEISPMRGRVHIKIYSGVQISPERSEILRMDLTARGSISDDPNRGMSLSDGLHLGRRKIVQTFVALTSNDAQRYWGLHNANDD